MCVCVCNASLPFREYVNLILCKENSWDHENVTEGVGLDKNEPWGEYRVNEQESERGWWQKAHIWDEGHDGN